MSITRTEITIEQETIVYVRSGRCADCARRAETLLARALTLAQAMLGRLRSPVTGSERVDGRSRVG